MKTSSVKTWQTLRIFERDAPHFRIAAELNERELWRAGIPRECIRIRIENCIYLELFADADFFETVSGWF